MLSAPELRILRSLADGGAIRAFKRSNLRPIVMRRRRQGRYGAFRCDAAVMDGLIEQAYISPSEVGPILTHYEITDAGRTALSDGGES